MTVVVAEATAKLWLHEPSKAPTQPSAGNICEPKGQESGAVAKPPIDAHLDHASSNNDDNGGSNAKSRPTPEATMTVTEADETLNP